MSGDDLFDRELWGDGFAPIGSTRDTAAAQHRSGTRARANDPNVQVAGHVGSLTEYRYSSTEAFYRAWRDAKEPCLDATIVQSDRTMTLSYRDQVGNVHERVMEVGEDSVGRYTADRMLPGHYHLGDPSWTQGGAEIEGTEHNGRYNAIDSSYGSAVIPIERRLGVDSVPVLNKSGALDVGTNERFHGGGSILGSAAFDDRQPLTPTKGCVRGHNDDVYWTAQMVQASGGTIPLEIQRGRDPLAVEVRERGQSHEMQDLHLSGRITEYDGDTLTIESRRGERETLSRSELLGHAADPQGTDATLQAAHASGEAVTLTVDADGQAHVNEAARAVAQPARHPARSR